jgi:endonuclease/exonuclease/phosphatase family metal-dependent hydrolase
MVWKLNVCTYNVMLTLPEPIRFNGQIERAHRIPYALATYSSQNTDLDVIVFVELISPETRKIVIDKMKKLGWPYVSDIITASSFSSSLKIVSGGVFIVSKYPILYQHNYVFEHACEGYDCSACKGVVFCRINKNGNVYNIIGTHFQAWDTPNARKIRQIQAKDCFSLIQSMSIPNDEPVIIAGDLNIDFYTRQVEILKLTEAMKIDILKMKNGSYQFSSDPSTNSIMGNDEDIMYATDMYPEGCYAEYMQTMRCPCCPQEWLDYIGYSNIHLKPTKSVMFVHKLKAESPFVMKFNMTVERSVTDLSDHYPVIGKFVFGKSTPFSNRMILTSLPIQKNISDTWMKVFITK